MVPSMGKLFDLLAKGGKKRTLIDFGQAPGTPEMGFIIGKEKVATLQESRGKMPIIDDEKGDAVLPAEGHHLLGVGGIVGFEEILEAGIKFGPITPAPGVGQFIGSKGPALGEGGNGVHQVGVAGDEGILGSVGQGGIDGAVGRVIFEPDPLEAPGAQAG